MFFTVFAWLFGASLVLGQRSTRDCTGATATPNTTFDYIVVGSGAGGSVAADRLSEAGHSVLLIERGPPSSGRWLPQVALSASTNDQLPETNWRPEWLMSTNLTRFDVPGLNQRIWADADGIVCDDLNGNTAGCVLGGGMAVNSALFWRPPTVDFDFNFPDGWKGSEMQDAINRVFARMPSTDHPSMDGVFTKPEGYSLLSSALSQSGWKNVTANSEPDEKNGSFSFANFYYQGGERAGILATYLVSAVTRPNTKLWTNTMVRRVIRDGSKITGVEVYPSDSGVVVPAQLNNGTVRSTTGVCGVVNITPGTGRVILAGGYYSTPKMLFRSGIGREAQLRVVAESGEDGADFIEESQWINLPVGENLMDHTTTDMQITHSSIQYYDFQTAGWENPVVDDINAYLQNRTGIFTTSAPNPGPIMWDVVDLGANSSTPESTTRQFQYTSRIAGATNNSMTMTQFLGRGMTSKGALSIESNLTMTFSSMPFLRTEDDRLAIIMGIKRVVAALSANPEITFTQPPSNMTVEAWVDSLETTLNKRRGIHYMGTAIMGTNTSASVVDLDTRVRGTENLFVVDASIMPGMVTTNPCGHILSVAEKAVQRIMALTNDMAVAGLSADNTGSGRVTVSWAPHTSAPTLMLSCLFGGYFALSLLIL